MQNTPTKPFAPSSEENKEVILKVLSPLFADKHSVLEIGSGTGQHAVYFARNMPQLQWQTSDLPDNHDGIRLWIEDSGLQNVALPITLNVSAQQWPDNHYDAVFSANSFHIMSQDNVRDLFAHINQRLNPQGLLVVYGPFNFNGQFTSPSNQQFDAFLKQRDPESGIKDFEWLNELAAEAGLLFKQDVAMPQNNRILCWQKP